MSDTLKTLISNGIPKDVTLAKSGLVGSRSVSHGRVYFEFAAVEDSDSVRVRIRADLRRGGIVSKLTSAPFTGSFVSWSDLIKAAQGLESAARGMLHAMEAGILPMVIETSYPVGETSTGIKFAIVKNEEIKNVSA